MMKIRLSEACIGSWKRFANENPALAISATNAVKKSKRGKVPVAARSVPVKVCSLSLMAADQA
jgi:hypothetical protein